MRAAQALAALAGRGYVIPDDVAALAVPILAHRLLLCRDAVIERRDPDEVLREIVADVPVPAESRGEAHGEGSGGTRAEASGDEPDGA